MKAIAKAEGVGPLSLSLELECSGATQPPPPPPSPPPGGEPGTMQVNGDLVGVQLLAPESEWYQRVDQRPVHPLSKQITLAQAPVVESLGRRLQNSFGPTEAFGGIPYAVGRGWPGVPVDVYLYPAESDHGPHPIPPAAPIEPGSDKHLIYHDLELGKTYELGMAARDGAGFRCEAAAVWSKHRGDDQRPDGWTSADAAGCPMLPGLVRFDELEHALAQSNPADQHLGHALRITLANTGHGYVYPARHYASDVPYALPDRPPMGMRMRVNPALDLSIFNLPSQVIMRTLQLFGAILVDNGSNWFLTGTFDPRWSKHIEAITGNVDGKIGIKSFAKQLFEDNWEVLDFTNVTTQV